MTTYRLVSESVAYARNGAKKKVHRDLAAAYEPASTLLFKRMQEHRVVIGYVTGISVIIGGTTYRDFPIATVLGPMPATP